MPESSRYGEVDNKQLGQLPLKTQSSRREISVAFKFNSWNMGITKRKNKYDCGARKFLPSNFILRTVIIRNSCQRPSLKNFYNSEFVSRTKCSAIFKTTRLSKPPGFFRS